MPVGLSLFIAIAGIAWLYTVVQYVTMLGHRKPEVSLTSLLTHGMRVFDPQYFTPRGHVYQAKVRRGFMAFFVCVLLGLALTFMAS